MYEIIFTKEAKKQLKKLSKREISKIVNKIEDLSLDPKPPGFKPLKGKLSEYDRETTE